MISKLAETCLMLVAAVLVLTGFYLAGGWAERAAEASLTGERR